ncbi:MAG: HupE/UreJ family protein [Cyanobacteria bacterium P01_G01_bin.38]
MKDLNVNESAPLKRPKVNKLTVIAAIATLTCVALVALASPAFAHHPFGGQTPSNGLEGFLSGLGHPVIGPDHLAFVIAVGLLAATQRWGLLTPIAFVGAALLGTGMHLLAWNLPTPELLISASVLGFGILLARAKTTSPAIAASLAVLAGIFHGYAYGEAIVGAEMTPLMWYLIGFSVIQLAIALSAFWLGQKVLKKGQAIRYAGFVICGAGAVFLSSAMGL